MAAYFMLARVGLSFGVSVETCIADYHGLPSSVFQPIHHLDRRYFRPSMWSYSLITTNPPVVYPTSSTTNLESLVSGPNKHMQPTPR